MNTVPASCLCAEAEKQFSDSFNIHNVFCMSCVGSCVISYECIFQIFILFDLVTSTIGTDVWLLCLPLLLKWSLLLLLLLILWLRYDFTCVRGWYALGEYTVCDDTKHTERKHHRGNDDTEVEHVLHWSLQKGRDFFSSNFNQGLFPLLLITWSHPSLCVSVPVYWDLFSIIH